MQKTSIHRITNYSLLKFVDGTNSTLQEFIEVNSELNLDVNQYLVLEDIEKTIWTSGNFKHQLNKIYSNDKLYTPSDISIHKTMNYQDVHLMLKQGFRWDDVFGLHVTIKNSKTDEILISRIVTISDLNLTGNKELIDGSFWLEECVLKIPKTTDILSCQVTKIAFEDIDNITGLLHLISYDFDVLIDEKPIPDYIRTIISFDENHFLKVLLKTDENKTLEKSILDYFEVSYADIQIYHLVNYGNENIGFKTFRISNENNKFYELVIGLNLLEFNNELVNIYVSSEIYVDGKLMKREAQLNTDLQTVNPFLQLQITHPTTNYPVQVIKENVINQNIIEAKQTTKIVPIFQPIFAEFVASEFKFERKDIYFNNVVNPTYLSIEAKNTDKNQILLSDITSDGKYYFDLTKLLPISNETTYNLIDVNSQKIISKGKVLIN